jgi:hypothetical protein
MKQILWFNSRIFRKIARYQEIDNPNIYSVKRMKYILKLNKLCDNFSVYKNKNKIYCAHDDFDYDDHYDANQTSIQNIQFYDDVLEHRLKYNEFTTLLPPYISNCNICVTKLEHILIAINYYILFDV